MKTRGRKTMISWRQASLSVNADISVDCRQTFEISLIYRPKSRDLSSTGYIIAFTSFVIMSLLIDIAKTSL